MVDDNVSHSSHIFGENQNDCFSYKSSQKITVDSVSIALFDMFSGTCDVRHVSIIFLNFILSETWPGFEKIAFFRH